MVDSQNNLSKKTFLGAASGFAPPLPFKGLAQRVATAPNRSQPTDQGRLRPAVSVERAPVDRPLARREASALEGSCDDGGGLAANVGTGCLRTLNLWLEMVHLYG